MLELFPEVEGWIAIDSIDLTGVSKINIACGWQSPPKSLSLEVRLDAADGKVLGVGNLPALQKNQMSAIVSVPVETVTGGNFHTIYILYKPKDKVSGGITSVQFGGK